jgi:predicted nucleotidyltransferase component of viral defense system
MMLTQAQVQRYAAESGLRDIIIAEKEIVLTYLLQLLSARNLLRRLAFKGGTCIRKMFLGSQGRFSTDLDFTGIEEHDHEDVILEMMGAFSEPFHGLQFEVPDDSYYESEGGLSWAVHPTYTHAWNSSGESEIKIQISRRETPTLSTEPLAQCDQSYFRFLPFVPAQIQCLQLPEILAEKIRAAYQRNKARDMYDLGIFAIRPLNQALVRRLVVLKLWQAQDSFDPDKLLTKFRDRSAFDWDDLPQLVRRNQKVDADSIIENCAKGYTFLKNLTADESALAQDAFQRRRGVWEAQSASAANLLDAA